MAQRCGQAEETALFLQAHNEEDALAFVEQIRDHFGLSEEKEIVCNPLSLSISCHIGPGALAIACSKAVPELLD